MSEVAVEEHRRAGQTIRELMAVYRDHEDLISIGAYRRGSTPTVDVAIEMLEQLDGFLRQAVGEGMSLEQTRQAAIELHRQASQRLAAAKARQGAQAEGARG